MLTLLILWAGITTILIVLLIYRGTLTMHEDDQLFLDDSNIHLAREQQELAVRMARIQPWLRICGAGSALLIVLITGMAIYTRLH